MSSEKTREGREALASGSPIGSVVVTADPVIVKRVVPPQLIAISSAPGLKIPVFGSSAGVSPGAAAEPSGIRTVPSAFLSEIQPLFA